MRIVNTLALSRRTAILASLSALAMSGPLRAGPRRTPRVLFVCQKGTVKSAIGRELLRDKARARGIAVKARSRGIQPKEGATPETRLALARDGIDTRREPLRRLAAGDARWADIVIAFDPLPFAVPGAEVRDWSGTPSVNAEYVAAIAAIAARVDSLLDQLAAIPRSTS